MEAAHIPWRPLGLLLVEKGLLTESELERALEEQAATGRRLGSILLGLGYVSRPALSRALAEQYGFELTTETGFGTGLRAQIERNHERGRNGNGAPALALVPEPADGAEPGVAEVLELGALEEQWARLADAEDRLHAAERELAALRRLARHRHEQVARFVARIRKRDRHLDGQRATLADAEDRLHAAERELAALRRLAQHRDEQVARFVARIRKRDRHLDGQSATLADAEDQLAVAERELAALRRLAQHRDQQVVRFVARVRDRDRRIDELSAAVPAEPVVAPVVGHVVFAQLTDTYELFERDGAAPEPDALLELDEGTFVVGRLGASPFPGDPRPCAFAQLLVDA